MDKLLSVIIVSYNERHYLEEAIESCLRQRCKFPFEIIIGDDGSSDGSLEVIKAYAERYPEIVRYYIMDRKDSQDVIPSFRVSELLKYGFAQSEGKYLTILSGDDLFLDEYKFQKQVDYLENNRKYIACHTDFQKFWDDGRTSRIDRIPGVSRAQFWAMEYVHISCFVFRREVLNHLLDRFCDDTGLLFSILCTGKSRYLPGVAFGYRQRMASIMDSADQMELCILELGIMQDAINHGGFENSTATRFLKPLLLVWEHRGSLGDKRYKKYRLNYAMFPNDILTMLESYDNAPKEEQIKLKKMIRKGNWYRLLFRIRRKIHKLLGRILGY